MDREKVIRSLERCLAEGRRPWMQDLRDAIALLKAQEPVEPTIGRCEEYDGHDSWWYQCGKCGTPIDYNDKYCRMCGQAVKWE